MIMNNIKSSLSCRVIDFINTYPCAYHTSFGSEGNSFQRVILYQESDNIKSLLSVFVEYDYE